MLLMIQLMKIIKTRKKTKKEENIFKDDKNKNDGKNYKTDL